MRESTVFWYPVASALILVGLLVPAGCSWESSLDDATCTDDEPGEVREGLVCRNGYWVSKDVTIVDSGPPAMDADADSGLDAMDVEVGQDGDVGVDTDTGVDTGDTGRDADTIGDTGPGDADTTGDTGDTGPMDADTIGDTGPEDADTIGDTGPGDADAVGDTTPRDADSGTGDTSRDTTRGDSGPDGSSDTSDTSVSPQVAGSACTRDSECKSGACLTNPASGPNQPANVCAHQVFVTSTTTDGTIRITSTGKMKRGLAAADQICQNQAGKQNMGGRTWKAILSTSSNPAKSRLKFSAAIVDTQSSPVKVADSKSHLFSRNRDLGTPIEHDASGMTISSGVKKVWTGTASDGTAKGPNCADWNNTNMKDGRYGKLDTTDKKKWLSKGKASCGNNKFRLYCVDGQ